LYELTAVRNVKMTALALVCQRVRDRHATLSNYRSDSLPAVGYPKPYFHLRPGGPRGILHKDTVGIEIYCLDPKTLLPYKLDPYFQPSMMLQNMGVPDVPDHIIWTNRQRWKTGLRVIDEPVTNPKIKMAVRLAKYVSFKMYGKVMEEKSARRMIAYYRSFYQNSPLRFEGRLFRLHHKQELMELQTSIAVILCSSL
jgi:hypothetical protein